MVSYPTPTPPPPTAREPGNRWLWLLVALASLAILLAVGYFLLQLLNQDRSRGLTVDAGLTPTPTLVGQRIATPGVSVPPTLQAPVTPTVLIPTPPPTPTAVPATLPPPKPAATSTAAPTLPPPPPRTTAAPPPAAPSKPAPAGAATPGGPPPQGQPVATAPPPPPASEGAPKPQPATPAAATQPTAPPTPTPFAGQVSREGGLGNTTQNLQEAFGAPVGETPGGLVVYRRGEDGQEYRVDLTPSRDRALLVVRVLPQDQPLPFEQAVEQSRQLFPRDAQPRAERPEGGQEFAVERFHSPTLAQAIPDELFRERGGQPGDFIVVYSRDAQGRVTRIAIGIGDDFQALRERVDQ